MTATLASARVVFARWKKVVPGARAIRVIVIHDMEYKKTNTAAADIAHDFATCREPKSAHLCVDNEHIIRCVEDSDVAYAAPGCNRDGLQIELAGFAAESRDDWLDDYNRAMLDNAAVCVASWCHQHGIPIAHLTDAELQAGGRGIVGHAQVSAVYKQSDHQDPGPNFPWDWFLEAVNAHAVGLA